MRKVVVVVMSLSVLGLGIVANAALADPNLNDIGAHRHFINGQPVGPDLCGNLENPGIQKAFNQFHANHHNQNVTGGQGPIAPGLHNGSGAELTALPGCG